MHTWLTFCLSCFACFCCPWNRKLVPSRVPAAFLFCFVPVSSLAEVKAEGRHVCSVNDAVFTESKVVPLCMSSRTSVSVCSVHACEAASVYPTSSSN